MATTAQTWGTGIVGGVRITGCLHLTPRPFDVSPPGAVISLQQATPKIPPTTAPAILPNARVGRERRRAIIAAQKTPKKRALAMVITKLFHGPLDRCIYIDELDETARRLNTDSTELIRNALAELAAYSKPIVIDRAGHLRNARSIGPNFAAVMEVALKHSDIFLIVNQSQLRSKSIPLSASFRKVIEGIVTPDASAQSGEAVAIILARIPPRSAIEEIKRLTQTQFQGMWCLWSYPKCVRSLAMSEKLASYLRFGTVRICTTSSDKQDNQQIRNLNRELERESGYERKWHWLRVVQSVAGREKQESLVSALTCCVPVVLGLKVLEHYAPKALTAVGGILDDLFLAIGPDAALNAHISDRSVPPAKRCKELLANVLAGGVGLIPAALSGILSTLLYVKFGPGMVGALSGAFFGIACCAGTFGTTVKALSSARASLEAFKASSRVLLPKNFGKKAEHRLVMREAIWSVPFRIGHTAIGVPIQILVGAIGGGLGLLQNGYFIGIVGSLESFLGILSAFSMERIQRRIDYRHLRHAKV